MGRLNLALLSVLIPVAVQAFPKYAYKPGHGHRFHHVGGTYATGGPTASYNSTAVGPTGTGTAAVSISSVTVTVVPTPLPSGSDNIQPPNVNVVHSDTSSLKSAPGENDTCGLVTKVVTSRNSNTVTITIGVPASSKVPVQVTSEESSASSPVLNDNTSSQTLLASDTTTPEVVTSEASSTSSASVPVPSSHSPSGSSRSKSQSISQIHSVTASAKVVPSSPSTSLETGSTPVTGGVSVPSSSEVVPSVSPPVPVYGAPPKPQEVSSASASVEATSTPRIYEKLVPSSIEASSSVPPAAQFYSAPPSRQEAPSPSLSTSLQASSPPVYQAPSSTSVATQPVPSTPSVSSPGTKRGLVYNSAALTQSFSSSPAISWCYNWDSQPGGDVPSNFEFVPMMWGPIEVHTANWNANADSAIAKGSKHLLGFNEPDLPEQANLTPQQAAESWHTYMEPYAGKAKLGSPAVCNGGGLTGLNWLNSFFDACSGCTIDFVPIHWYGLANDAGVADFKDHTAKAVAAAKGKPVWITEFKPDGSPEETASFMAQILPFLDSNPGVERYSWFEVDGILVSGGSLTPLGSTYAA